MSPYFTSNVDDLYMSDPIYDLNLGNIPNVRGPNDPDRNWKSDVMTVN